jgi:type IV secretion system protein VirB4
MPPILPDKLPWQALVGPVRNTDGSLQLSFRLYGPDLSGQPREVKGSAALRANNAIRRLGAGWVLYSEARRVPATDYPSSRFPHPLAQRIDDERRDWYLSPGRHFYSEYYLTLRYLPPMGKSSWVQELWVQGQAPTQTTSEQEHIRTFAAEAAHLAGLLAGDQMLKQLDASETLTYLHSCISHKRHKVAVPRYPLYLSYQLCDSAFRGGLDLQLGPHHLKVISISDFPDRSLAGLLQGLDNLGFEYRWTTRYIATPKHKAKKIMQRIQQQWFSQRKSTTSRIIEQLAGPQEAILDSDAINKAQAIDHARQEIGADIVGYGQLTDVIVVWDRDHGEAERRARVVEELINDAECVARIEELGAEDAWLSSVPGDVSHNPVRPMLSSLNRVHMLPGLLSVWSGPEWNERLNGPPLFYATTGGSTPFRVSTHAGERGNVLVLGPIRSGKTALVGFSAMQFLRYRDARIVMFQVKGGGKCETLCLGGRYIDLGAMGPSFQPYRDIHIRQELEYRQEWTCDRLEEGRIPVSVLVRSFVGNALDKLSRAPVAQRTITELINVMRSLSAKGERTAPPKRGPQGISEGLSDETKARRLWHLEICEALSYYCGGILDADHDTPLDASVQCLEWESFLENSPRLVPAVLTHVWHELDRGFTGDPVLFIVDEFNRLVSQELIVSRIDRVVRTYGFRNVAMVVATQAVEDILSVRIGPLLLQSCPTRILLPNGAALSSACRAAYEALGLTPEQIQTIAQARPKRDYFFQRESEGGRLFELQLEGMALEVSGRSRPEHLRLMDQVLAAYGAKDFWRGWLQTCGLSVPEAEEHEEAPAYA